MSRWTGPRERRLRHLVCFRDLVNAAVQAIHPRPVGLGRQVVRHLQIQIGIGWFVRRAASSEKS